MKTALRLALAAAALVALAACNKVTAENYAKVRVGMGYEEVVAVLGKPTSCDEVAAFKSCRWGDEQSNATIRFAANKVVLHTAKNIK